MQLVVQVLAPVQGKGNSDRVVAAVINAGTLALLCAVMVGRRKADSVVVVDPGEEEELTAGGIFTYLIGGGADPVVCMSSKTVGGGRSMRLGWHMLRCWRERRLGKCTKR